MKKKSWAALSAVGLAAAIAVPTIAFGNARSALPTGSLNFLQTAQTPFVAQLTGPNEIAPAGDPDGLGGAAVTFDIVDPLDPLAGAQVCWDLSYSGLTGTPILAHIHQGVAGVNGPIVVPFVPFTDLGPTSATGCANIDPGLAQQIMNTPSNFYVNVHTSDFPNGAIRGQLSAGPIPAGEAHLLPAPLRAYDSRNADGPLALNTTRTVSLANGKDSTGANVIAVPPGATAAIVTLTVTDTAGNGGFLKLYSAALGTPPSTSSINWFGPGQNLAVTTQVAVDSAGQVKVTDGANPTNFLIDVIGYLF